MTFEDASNNEEAVDDDQDELPLQEDVLYFPMKVAVNRLGGVQQTSALLNTTKDAVTAWLMPSQRTRPAPDVLEELSRRSGVSMQSFIRYFERLDLYKQREKFRRR